MIVIFVLQWIRVYLTKTVLKKSQMPRPTMKEVDLDES